MSEPSTDQQQFDAAVERDDVLLDLFADIFRGYRDLRDALLVLLRTHTGFMPMPNVETTDVAPVSPRMVCAIVDRAAWLAMVKLASLPDPGYLIGITGGAPLLPRTAANEPDPLRKTS